MRGSTEHFYRRSETILVRDEDLLEMPEEVSRLLLTTIVRGFLGRVARALRGGTLTARTDTHVTWKAVKLDEQGWKEVTEILGSTYQAVDEAEARALERLEESGEERLIATVGLAAFESPPDDD